MYGMYMTRITTSGYGTWLLQLTLANMVVSVLLSIFYKTPNYIAIFISSGVLLSLLEYMMVVKGVRTSRMIVYGKQVGPLADSFIKGGAEGPGLCVPALFAADQIYMGNYFAGIVLPCVYLFLFSGYWALAEMRGLKQLKEGEPPIINRRWMNKPESMFVVGIVNLIVAVCVMRMEPENQRHALFFIVMFFVVLQVFFIVHSLAGIRRIDKYDPATGVYAPESTKYSFIGYTFDSIFEMALLNTPYYLIPYAIGVIVIPKLVS